MAKNCNYEHNNSLKPQGKGRVAPSSFARNNLAKGGVNAQMLGSLSKSTGTAKRK
jgi:hypothetical protein